MSLVRHSGLKNGQCVLELSNSLAHLHNLAMQMFCVCEDETKDDSGPSDAREGKKIRTEYLAQWKDYLQILLGDERIHSKIWERTIRTDGWAASTNTRCAWHFFVTFQFQPDHTISGKPRRILIFD
jgi:hypothetical protein